MKIGLLGGSFNPIHNGHLAIAETVLQELSLAEVWFVPTAFHPLKSQDQLLSFNKRLKLLSKVLESYPKFKISLLDSNQNARNYTYDLIQKIKASDNSFEPVFIIGSDILSELTQWFKYEWLLENVTFAVVSRPGKQLKYQLRDDDLKNLKFLEMDPVPVSSTDIRKKIKEDQPIIGLVPDCIISDIKLYYKT
ncbi:nicotinate (nicotinamide) nucleotide adenylyltransferase [Candidatus Cloacimonadota bacterium]